MSAWYCLIVAARGTANTVMKSSEPEGAMWVMHCNGTPQQTLETPWHLKQQSGIHFVICIFYNLMMLWTRVDSMVSNVTSKHSITGDLVPVTKFVYIPVVAKFVCIPLVAEFYVLVLVLLPPCLIPRLMSVGRGKAQSGHKNLCFTSISAANNPVAVKECMRKKAPARGVCPSPRKTL